MPTARRALEPLLTEVRARSTGTGSHIHGELHWRTVGVNGLWLAEPLDGADTFVIFLSVVPEPTGRGRLRCVRAPVAGPGDDERGPPPEGRAPSAGWVEVTR